MSADSCKGRFFLVLLGGIVLSACSRTAATAVPPVQAAAQPAVLAAAAAPAAAPLVTGLPDFTGLVERYGPAVVNVQVTEGRPQRARGGGGDGDDGREDPFGDFFRRFGIPNQPRNGQPQHGVGSGFIVTPDGYIMTNAHVVRDASEVVVKMTDRREYKAKVVGIDDRTDVAVIKIEGRNLPTVKIGDPSVLKPGQWVVAIGSPFDMENSVTAGIVSATSRALPNDVVPFIQTDVAVNPGNSGGPLFNMNGEVVGINSQIFSQSGGYMGLSFAIPIDLANNVRTQLVTKGRVTRGMIGVNIKPLDANMAEAWGLDRPRGALVDSVVKGGPAEKAGLKGGDIILSVDGRKIENGETELPTLISAMAPGKDTELEIWRDRGLRKVTARVTEMKDGDSTSEDVSGSGGSASGTSALGLSVRPLQAEERQEVDTQGSLVVDDVDGPAAKAGIQPGDIILGVGGVRVKTAADLAAAVKRSGSVVPLLIQRGDRQTYVAIRKE